MSVGTGTIRRLATMAATTDTKNYKFNHTMSVSRSNTPLPLQLLTPSQAPRQRPQGVRYFPPSPPPSSKPHTPSPLVKFYSFLGLSLLRTLPFPDAKFDLYFLGYDAPLSPSSGRSLWDREGLIELTHNYGTESDPDYKINNGNVEPHRGFGHVCVSVDHLQAACARLEAEGYRFQKKLSDGRMRHVAFVLDPDGYWVEVIGKRPVEETEGVEGTDVGVYRMVSCFLSPFWRVVLMLGVVEPHDAARQGRGKVAGVLPGRAGHDAGADERE